MAKIRPDQLEQHPIKLDSYSMNYLLEEMKSDVEDQKKIMEKVRVDTQSMDLILDYLNRYQQLVNGINPSTNEPFTQTELALIRFFEEIQEKARRFDEGRY